MDVYDFAVEGTHTYFANGFAVHNQEAINIQRGAYPNPFSEDGVTMNYQSGGPILHFEFGDSDQIPDDIGGGLRTKGTWKQGHSWKFETFVYPVFPGTTSQYTASMDIYPDDGVNVRIREYPDGDWAVKNCTQTCTMQYTFNEYTWYQIQVYLFNDPVGTGEDDNPTGVMIDDGTGKTILELFGGIGYATMNSFPPGIDETIDDTFTFYSDELRYVRQLGAFSVEYQNARETTSEGVELSMMNDCQWKSIELPVTSNSWRTNIFYIRSGNIGEPYNVSNMQGVGRDKYSPDPDERGGVYECKRNWPEWEDACGNSNDRLEYGPPSSKMYCCYVDMSELDVSGADDGDLTLNNYDDSFDAYIMNYLPGKGSKLCSYKSGVSADVDVETLYMSNYTNEFCNEITGNGCCYCRLGYGCRLDCLNERNMSGSDLFTLPFALSGLEPPDKWEIDIDGLELSNNHPNIISMTAEGNERDGWMFSAVLNESAAGTVLYRNHTIFLNLYSDFGLYVPEYVSFHDPGYDGSHNNTYEVRVNVTVDGEGSVHEKDGVYFDSVECLTPGQTRSFYDGPPGTVNRGICRPGTEVCRNLTLTNYEWVYENTHDKPVTPQTESGVCDGIDNDCNGIIDDVMSFDSIIDEIIDTFRETNVLKTPYEVTGCGCFMGRNPVGEVCNGIDDDCDGTTDNTEKTITVNNCSEAVWECIEGGESRSWCFMLYNSSTECGINYSVTINETQNLTINTCTKEVVECLENKHIDIYTLEEEDYDYDECKHIYTGFCSMEEIEVKVLEGGTCACADGQKEPGTDDEVCDGIDNDCNGIIDDVESPETCKCAFLTNTSLIQELKDGGDASCNGIDDDCDGTIDEDARDCACAGRSPEEATEIRGNVVEICDGVDNDCDGLVDENFPSIDYTDPKPCGYGICSGGFYVCGVHGEGAVCNTTVTPDETFLGNAVKIKQDETCDLLDNDCDYSIDEGCACTPEGAIKLCGYHSGIFYKNRTQLDSVCNQVIDGIKGMITWAEAPENMRYRMVLNVTNTEDVYLTNYPVSVTLNTSSLIGQDKMRSDGGDLRIVPAGEELHMPWGYSEPFVSEQTEIWFKTDLPPDQEKRFYIYYGNPTATYDPLDMTSAVGLDYETGVFLLCHFDGDSTCEGNMIPKYEDGTSYATGKYLQGINLSSGSTLSYPTSANFNKNRGTMVMWFNPSDLTNDHYLFYSEDFDGDSQFALYFNGSGTFFEVWDKNGVKYTVNGGVVDTSWHHLAVTWDNLRGIEIYMDGVREGYEQVTWEPDDTGLDVYVGSNGSGRNAEAVIDELAVHSQILEEDKIREKMRYYVPSVETGPEETMEETVERGEVNVFEKCNEMLQNVSFTGNTIRDSILSLCDSIRICNKTDFPISPTSECTFGNLTCTGGVWGNCSVVEPTNETCNQKDDDCNGIIDDVAFPETCGCSDGGEPRSEICNGIDDNCDGVIDNVRWGDSPGDSVESTHCGCFNQIVNITQRNAELETECNGIDDNCDGTIDEGLDNCACAGTLFSPNNNTLEPAISAEMCDEVDNNCNGIIDDPWLQDGSAATELEYLGAPCGYQYSSCSGGMYVCSEGGTGIVCSTTSDDGIGGQDMRGDETCNGIDDDCDGIIDDVWGNVSYKFCQCHNGVPGSEEVCDGRDNNCNGFVDDGLTGCGCSFDLEVNVSNINQLASLVTAKRNSDEVCNNMDDDCNMKVDDGTEGGCFCSGGFSGDPSLRPEFCNGIDDDCDGTVDDVAFPETCGCYEAAREQGEIDEICDGIDNDCNGLIDENWPNLGGICGFGVCSGGVYECSSDLEEQVCSTGPGGSEDESADEVCGDNIDNDCDGAVDENCVCDEEGEQKKCSKNVGVCEEGVQTCIEDGGEFEWSGCIGGVLPEPEVCDGLDNNCNGIIDDVPGGKCGCYGGGDGSEEICNGIDDDCNGVIDNVGGEDSIEETKCGCYNNLYGVGAKIEICNGIDDNCDGIIDNVKEGDSVTATKCACYGGESPGTEACNGIDDDCDGQIDEEWPTLGESCGEGICTGILLCSEGGSTAECSGQQPETEVCDGKDNNCNGKIDEGCWGPEISSCENGIQDGDEEGVDCGGSCPDICAPPPPPPPSGTWVIVFAVLVIIIVIVGLILLFFKQSV